MLNDNTKPEPSAKNTSVHTMLPAEIAQRELSTFRDMVLFPTNTDCSRTLETLRMLVHTDDRLDDDQLLSQLALRFNLSVCNSRLDCILYDDETGTDHRMYVRLPGYETPQKKTLWMELFKNAAGSPPWTFAGFCHSGQTEISKELADLLLEDRSKNQNSSLLRILTGIKNHRQETGLVELLCQAAQAVGEGRPIDFKTTLAIKEYNKLWKTLRLTLNDDSCTSFYEVEHKLAGFQKITEQLKNAGSLIQSVVRQVNDLFSQFCAGSAGQSIDVKTKNIIRQDREAIDSWLKSIDVSESVPVPPQEVIDVYAALCALPVTHDRGVKFTVAEHFDMDRGDLSYFVEDFGQFLSLWSQPVEKAAAEIKSALAERKAIRSNDEPQKRRPTVLRILKDRLPLYQALSRLSPVPNAFEQLLIRGEKANKLLSVFEQDSSSASFYDPDFIQTLPSVLESNKKEYNKFCRSRLPEAVGDRLYLLQGNKNGHAERYWLIAGAYDRLLHLYRCEERAEEFLNVFLRSTNLSGITQEDLDALLPFCRSANDYTAAAALVSYRPELLYALHASAPDVSAIAKILNNHKDPFVSLLFDAAFSRMSAEDTQTPIYIHLSAKPSVACLKALLDALAGHACWSEFACVLLIHKDLLAGNFAEYRHQCIQPLCREKNLQLLTHFAPDIRAVCDDMRSLKDVDRDEILSLWTTLLDLDAIPETDFPLIVQFCEQIHVRPLPVKSAKLLGRIYRRQNKPTLADFAEIGVSGTLSEPRLLELFLCAATDFHTLSELASRGVLFLSAENTSTSACETTRILRTFLTDTDTTQWAQLKNLPMGKDPQSCRNLVHLLCDWFKHGRPFCHVDPKAHLTFNAIAECAMHWNCEDELIFHAGLSEFLYTHEETRGFHTFLTKFLCSMLLADHLTQARNLWEVISSHALRLTYHDYLADLMADLSALPQKKVILELLISNQGKPPSSTNDVYTHCVWPVISAQNREELRSCVNQLDLVIQKTEDYPLGQAFFCAVKQYIASDREPVSAEQLELLFRAQYSICHTMTSSTTRQWYLTRNSRTQLESLLLTTCLLAFAKGLSSPDELEYSRQVESLLVDIEVAGVAKSFSASALLKVRDRYYSNLCTSSQPTLTFSVILAHITGNWKHAILELFRSDCTVDKFSLWLSNQPEDRHEGLCRGILNAYVDLSDEYHNEFRQWLLKNIPCTKVLDKGNKLAPTSMEVPFLYALHLIEAGCYDKDLGDHVLEPSVLLQSCSDLLSLPIEETCIPVDCLMNTILAPLSGVSQGNEIALLQQRIQLTVMLQGSNTTILNYAHRLLLNTPSDTRESYKLQLCYTCYRAVDNFMKQLVLPNERTVSLTFHDEQVQRTRNTDKGMSKIGRMAASSRMGQLTDQKSSPGMLLSTFLWLCVSGDNQSIRFFLENLPSSMPQTFFLSMYPVITGEKPFSCAEDILAFANEQPTPLRQSLALKLCLAVSGGSSTLYSQQLILSKRELSSQLSESCAHLLPHGGGHINFPPNTLARLFEVRPCLTPRSQLTIDPFFLRFARAAAAQLPKCSGPDASDRIQSKTDLWTRSCYAYMHYQYLKETQADVNEVCHACILAGVLWARTPEGIQHIGSLLLSLCAFAQEHKLKLPANSPLHKLANEYAGMLAEDLFLADSTKILLEPLHTFRENQAALFFLQTLLDQETERRHFGFLLETLQALDKTFELPADQRLMHLTAIRQSIACACDQASCPPHWKTRLKTRLDANIFKWIKQINQKLTTKPKKAEMYTVRYEYTGQIPASAPHIPSSMDYEVGEPVVVAPLPVLEGFSFSGWNMDNFTMPKNNVLITGCWEPIQDNPGDTQTHVPECPPDPQVRTVSYRYVGSIPPGVPPVPAPTQYRLNDPVTIAPAPPDLEGYVFSGWDKQDGFNMPSWDVEILGHWISNSTF